MIRAPRLAQLKAAADVARDWAALLYTPVLTAYAVWVTALMAWAHPWAKATEPQRLTYLGMALIGALCLIGLGTLFYQRRPPPRVRARTAAGELEIGGGDPDTERPAPEGRGEGDAGLASAPVVQVGAPEQPPGAGNGSPVRHGNACNHSEKNGPRRQARASSRGSLAITPASGQFGAAGARPERPPGRFRSPPPTQISQLEIAMKLDARAERSLSGVHPDLARIVRRAAEITTVDFTVTEGRRTADRQRRLVRAGASRTLNSRHLTGHAVDLAAKVDGTVRWDWPLYARLAEAMKRAAAELDLPLVWGGDWRSFRDGPHFELPREAYP